LTVLALLSILSKGQQTAAEIQINAAYASGKQPLESTIRRDFVEMIDRNLKNIPVQESPLVSNATSTATQLLNP
jgi:hypothetical protein